MSEETEVKARKQGILRVDTGRSRRASPVCVSEDATEAETGRKIKYRVISKLEPTSPQPSVDRLSVSFANDERKTDSTNIIRTSITEDNESEGDEEDEYSASANVILERKQQESWKRKSGKRRGSAAPTPPPTGQRRRSSVFTSSSETGISVEGAANQNLRIHKEVVAQIKYQPWPIRRKLRLVQQAKSYIKLHEGQLQERLAQKKSTKDILAHFKIIFLNYWNYFMRELCNLVTSLCPWESRIKKIESHFGSAVASYFTFHRWLFLVNLVISIALLLLVIIPEVLFASYNSEFAGDRKCMLSDEVTKSKKFLTLWNFEGILKHSPIFYGYYNSRSSAGTSLENKFPFVYFVTGIGLYVYSFIAILRKMAVNSRQSKLTEKDEYYIFTWKIFTSWDFMIGNFETAQNRISSIILGFKEALLEEAEKTREDKRNWKLLVVRLLTHSCVLCLLASSVYLVVIVVSRSQIAEAGKQSDTPTGWWRQNEITIVITLIGMVYPVLFDVIGLAEKYHPRKALRIQLARIMVLNLLNLYAFIIATFTNIHTLACQSCQNMPNLSAIETYKAFEKTNIPGKNSAAGMKKHILTGTLLLFTAPTDSPISLANLYDPSQENSMNNMDFDTGSILLTNFEDNKYLQDEVDGISPQLMKLNKSVVDNTNMVIKASILDSNKDLNKVGTDMNTVSTIDYSATTEEYNKTTLAVIGSDIVGTTIDFVSIPDQGDLSTENGSRSTYFTEETDVDWASTFREMDNGTEISFASSMDVTISTEAMVESSDNETLETAGYETTSSSTEPLKTASMAGGFSTASSSHVSSTPSTTVTSSSHYTTDDTSYTTQPSLLPVPKGCNQFVCEARIKKTSGNEDFSPYVRFLSQEERKKVHSQCWETMFGQELVKLTVMDLLLTVMSILMVDFFRAILVRFLNGWWFWDLEKKFPQYGDFKIAENILHLVNNQGMVWMGMFFSPGLPIINVLKLVVLMYIRSWAVLTCNVPHEVVFKASKSNNFYFGLLLTMLFLCVLPVGYALVWIDTSWHCGPFSRYNRIYYLFTNSMPATVQYVFSYVASPGIVIPLLVLLVLIIIYLISLTSALREANDDLKMQLRHERTEERRKVFQMANKKRKGPDSSESPFNKWCHAINNNSTKTSLDLTPSLAHSEKQAVGDTKGRQKSSTDKKFSITSDSFIRSLHSDDGSDRKDSLPDSFREREDSVISCWSVENVPEIRISESDSQEISSRPSPDTRSKSSSKETVINVEPVRKNDRSRGTYSQDDVFLEGDHKLEAAKDASSGSREESITYADSYDSISKSLEELHDMGREKAPEAGEKSHQIRKDLAKILVEGLKKE